MPTTLRRTVLALFGGAAALAARSDAAPTCMAPRDGCHAGPPRTLSPLRSKQAPDVLRLDARVRGASVARMAPAVDVTPQSPDYRLVDMGGTHLSYSTPSYVSLDAPRGVTLAYSSSIAAPRAFVQVDATDNSTEVPVRMSIRVKDGAGAWLTPETFFVAGAGANRLAVAWTPSVGTGVQSYTAAVRSYWSDGSFLESTAALRVPIVTDQFNTAYTHVGAGWFIAGQQRIRLQSDGVMWLTEGDGTIKAFGPADASGVYPGPPGDFTTLQWVNGAGYVRRYPDGGQVVFSGWGEMVAEKDRFGNTTTWNYDSNWVLQSIVDPVGKAITFGYTGGMLTSITDPGSRVTRLAYTNGDLTQITAPDGVVDLGASYQSHRLQSWWDRQASTRTAYYDFNDRAASLFEPQVTLWDGSAVYPKHMLTSWETAVLARQNMGTASSPSPRVIPANAKMATTDPRGNTTWTALTSFGRPARTRDPAGRTSFITWNTNQQPTRTLSYNGHAVSFTWNGPDLVTVWDEQTGQTVHAEYEATYHQRIHVYGSTLESRSYYGSTGALDSSRVSGAPATKYVHDPRGRLVSEIDAEGHGTFYTYGDADGSNGWGNLHIQSSGAASSSFRRISTFAYDGYGRTVASVDPDNHTDSTYYDVVNRVKRGVNGAGQSVSYTYTGDYLTQVADAKGQTYGFGYNAAGWRTSETDPRGQVISYAFDASGNVAASTNRRGQIVRSTYDVLDRPSTRTDVASGAVTSFSYDPQGRWVVGTNAESTDTLRYDELGRNVGQVTVRGSVRYAVSVAYNANGQRSALTMTSPWSRTIGYRYDACLQLDTLIDLAGGRTLLDYDNDGSLTGTHLPNGFNITSEITSTHAAGQYTFDGPLLFHRLDVGFSLDSLGRRSTRWNAAGDSSREYTYDRAGRLTGWQDWFSQPATCTGTLWSVDNGPQACGAMAYRELQDGASFTYDAVGNRTGSSVTLELGNRLLHFGPYSMQFDADGSMTSKAGNGKTQSLVWNAEGQLVSVTTNGATTTYGYDAFGRRVRKTTPSATTRYLYDGDNLLMELDGSGNPIREYTYYPGVDNPHSVRQGGQTYYYLTEALGSVVGLVDQSGQVVNEYRYEPWGGLQSSSEAVPNVLRFAAREYDPESGLYYNRARYYDPETNRFISEDPLGLGGGINPYVYAGNDPVNFSDPSGLCEEMALVNVTWYSDGTLDWTVLGYYWAGDDCGGRGGTPGPAGKDRPVNKRERSRLKCIANHYVKPSTRSIFLEQLQRGNVYVGKRIRPDHKPALGYMDPYVDPMRIVFAPGSNGGAIGLNELSLADVLAHEVGHHVDATKLGQQEFASRYASDNDFQKWAEDNAREYSADHVRTERGGSPLCPGV